MEVAKPIFLRSGFNYDRDAASLEAGFACAVDDDKTQQSFKDEVDINTIVKRFGLTGQLPDDFSMPMQGDFADVPDFQTALNLVISAQEEFMKVPAEVRARFANDPGELMAFLGDAKNRDEAIKLGLVVPPPEKTRDVVEAVDELASKLVPKV